MFLNNNFKKHFLRKQKSPYFFELKNIIKQSKEQKESKQKIK